MKDRVRMLAAGIGDKLIAYRRQFHKFPESGWTEFRTSCKIAEILKQLGYRVRLGDEIICRETMMGVPSSDELERHMKRAVDQGASPDLVSRMKGGLTGVVADLYCGPGPVFALRFDMDANDISEVKEESHRPFREGFASVHPNVMHACGHDGHIALGLGTAELLARLKGEIRGTVRLIFQPAEEGVRGAGPMVDQGMLDNVEFILGGHIGFLAKNCGRLVCGVGNFLATTKFDVAFEGAPSHAGKAPEQGRNALLAAACTALNLHAIPRHGQGISRICVGRIEAGLGRNITPPNGLIKAETRGETTEIDHFMFESAQRVIAGAAAMYDVKFRIVLMGKTGSGTSSPGMSAILAETARGIPYFTPDEIVDYQGMGGSEDFSRMMTHVQEQGGQGTYFSLGTTLAAGHHDYRFDFDESCLVPGVELIVNAVLQSLS